MFSVYVVRSCAFALCGVFALSNVHTVAMCSLLCADCFVQIAHHTPCAVCAVVAVRATCVIPVQSMLRVACTGAAPCAVRGVYAWYAVCGAYHTYDIYMF